MGTDNSTSSTSQSSGGTSLYARIHTAALVIYCIIFIFGILGNGLVIYVTGCRMKRTVNSVWFLNLALADFLFTTFLIFSIVSLSQTHQWIFGQFMCKLTNFVALVNMFASVFLLTAISLDRCLCIWVVVWAQNRRTVRKAQVMSAIIWVTAAICSAPFATFRTVQQRGEYSRCVYPNDMTIEQKWILYSFRFVMGFFIPFLLILVSYVAIAIRAGRIQRARKQRSRRIICSVIVAFFICWLPFHIFSFLELKARTNPALWTVVRIGSTFTVCLAFMNSCLNPVLYVFMCDEFQKKLRQSLCFVLESALAEDHLSFMSSRSLSSHFSRLARKSDSAPPEARRDTATCLTLNEKKEVINEDTASTE